MQSLPYTLNEYSCSFTAIEPDINIGHAFPALAAVKHTLKKLYTHRHLQLQQHGALYNYDAYKRLCAKKPGAPQLVHAQSSHTDSLPIRSSSQQQACKYGASTICVQRIPLLDTIPIARLTRFCPPTPWVWQVGSRFPCRCKA